MPLALILTFWVSFPKFWEGLTYQNNMFLNVNTPVLWKIFWCTDEGPNFGWREKNVVIHVRNSDLGKPRFKTREAKQFSQSFLIITSAFLWKKMKFQRGNKCVPFMLQYYRYFVEVPMAMTGRWKVFFLSASTLLAVFRFQAGHYLFSLILRGSGYE